MVVRGLTTSGFLEGECHVAVSRDVTTEFLDGLLRKDILMEEDPFVFFGPIVKHAHDGLEAVRDVGGVFGIRAINRLLQIRSERLGILRGFKGERDELPSIDTLGHRLVFMFHLKETIVTFGLYARERVGWVLRVALGIVSDES